MSDDLQAKLDWHGLTMASVTACMVSIRANTIDFQQPLTPEQYEELNRIYDAALKLQQWIVFGEKPADAVDLRDGTHAGS